MWCPGCWRPGAKVCRRPGVQISSAVCMHGCVCWVCRVCSVCPGVQMSRCPGVHQVCVHQVCVQQVCVQQVCVQQECVHQVCPAGVCPAGVCPARMCPAGVCCRCATQVCADGGRCRWGLVRNWAGAQVRRVSRCAASAGAQRQSAGAQGQQQVRRVSRGASCRGASSRGASSVQQRCVQQR